MERVTIAKLWWRIINEPVTFAFGVRMPAEDATKFTVDCKVYFDVSPFQRSESLCNSEEASC